MPQSESDTLRRAVDLLREGDYVSGFSLYEARLNVGLPLLHQSGFDHYCQRWRGDLSFSGDLFIVSEGGYGDIFQFMRYGLWLRSHSAARITAVVRGSAYALVQQSGAFDRCCRAPFDLSLIRETDQWAPMMSLPMYLGVTRDNLLIDSPYLKLEPGHVLKWHERISLRSGFVVGLHWQGSIRHERVDLLGLKGRSFPLEAYSPLATVPNISFISLQKGPGMEQLIPCSFRRRFHPSQNEVDQTWCYLETAAIVNSCDLVITNDSGLAHLAGGLGHPCWLLLMRPSNWRWGEDGSSTPWYPSLRLFRQRSIGDWHSLMLEVADELQCEVTQQAKV